MIDGIKILLTGQEIERRISELAAEINSEIGDEDVVAICSLKGAAIFASDLVRKLTMPLTLEFIEVSSYGNETESKNEITVVKDISASLEGKNVLFIEDIVDTGQTMNYIQNLISGHNPKRLLTCILLDNPARRVKPVSPDFLGFKIPNKFVIGYGLDYKQKYRNLPYIAYIEN